MDLFFSLKCHSLYILHYFRCIIRFKYTVDKNFFRISRNSVAKHKYTKEEYSKQVLYTHTLYRVSNFVKNFN